MDKVLCSGILWFCKIHCCSVTSCVQLYATPWTSAYQAFLSQSLLKFMNIMSVTLSNHLILCHLLLLLPSIFPSIRVFHNELALPIRWPKFWCFIFSISPSNEYTGLISFNIEWLSRSTYPEVEQVSLLSKRYSRVFSSTMIWKHQFSGTQLSLWSNSHIRKWLLEKP